MGRAGSRPSAAASRARTPALPLIAVGALVVAAGLLTLAPVLPGLVLPLGITTVAAAASMAGGLIAVGAWWRERRRVATVAAKEEAARHRLEGDLERAREEITGLEVAMGGRDVELARHREQLARRDDELAESRRAAEAAQARVAELESDSGRLQSELSERDAALERERAGRAALERARDAEARWISQLRTEIFRLQRERGVLADSRDIPGLVLRIAVTLLEAKKGLLFARPDGGPEGPLDLVASEGFDHDPHDSAVAQRFAGEVLERDRIVREDQPHSVVAGRRTSADEEIENIVAIPIYLMDEFSGVVVCANREGGFESCDEEVLLALGGQAGTLLHGARLQHELRSSYLATVQMLADAVEAKDGSLRGHCDEVADYAGAVADRLGLDPRKREEIVFGSLLHDVGKIGVSERILLKPGPLTLEEFGVVKLHPRIGYRLVQRVPSLDPISLGILHHHERYDGRGYPAGLRGEEIPREARIIAVADAFSAMVSDRPYRRRMSLAQACKELERAAGTHFDPEIVRLFVDEVRRRPFRDDPTAMQAALSDPEVQTRLSPGESVLGQGPFEVTDSLTLLYSHRYLQELVHAETHRAEVQESPFAVVLVQLEGIPEINRREGYAAGDAAIRASARVVERVAARAGGSACRYSGRRLAIVAPHTTLDEARALANEVASELGPDQRVRVGMAAWRMHDSETDVVARARRMLDSTDGVGSAAARRTATPAARRH